MEQVNSTKLNLLTIDSYSQAMNSFDKQIHQMSTPLHPPPNYEITKGTNRSQTSFAFEILPI